jgi:tetratricopeptide (TPR) repeat protein
MAKKKEGSPRKSPKAAPKAGRPRQSSFPQFDTDALRELASLVDRLKAVAPTDDVQTLLREAYRLDHPAERIALAERALAIAPDSVDAHLLLADSVATRKDALEYAEKAVAAAARALGPEPFKNHVGRFGELAATRSYLRARERVAHLLWTLGRRGEAIAHLQEMLVLNPSDNQGVRYSLAAWLLAEGRNAEVECLLADYDGDENAAWPYNRTLLTFRQQGDSAAARTELAAAKKRNKYVLDYLLDRKGFPSQPPEMYASGSREEAILYAGTALSAWKSTPDAIDWLQRSTAKKKRKPQTATPQGPLPLVKKRLRRLPQTDDVWQADFRQCGPRIEEQGELSAPWILLVVSCATGVILEQDVTFEPPTAELLWDKLAAAMQSPLAGDGFRPASLQVATEGVWTELRPHLEELDVELQLVSELEQLDEIFEEMTRSLLADQPPGLLDMPGVAVEHVAGFYQAAAEFYTKAPWRRLGYESAIRIESTAFDSGPWYAVVMGQSGLTFGVALYEDLKVLERLWAGKMSDEDNARETVALSVTFGDAADCTDADLNAIDQYDFDVAGTRAYPTIFRKERGMTLRPPLGWELVLMEACLRAIPEFIAERPQDNLATYVARVPVSSGPLTLSMEWLDV